MAHTQKKNYRGDLEVSNFQRKENPPRALYVCGLSKVVKSFYQIFAVRVKSFCQALLGLKKTKLQCFRSNLTLKKIENFWNSFTFQNLQLSDGNRVFGKRQICDQKKCQPKIKGCTVLSLLFESPTTSGGHFFSWHEKQQKTPDLENPRYIHGCLKTEKCPPLKTVHEKMLFVNLRMLQKSKKFSRFEAKKTTGSLFMPWYFFR